MLYPSDYEHSVHWGGMMENSQVVELVIIESQNGNGLFVLDWEYDRVNNDVLSLRLFAFDDWKGGRREHPVYLAPRGELALYERDPSGYISTSKRLRSLEENGKWYDEYGRCYARCGEDLRLSELKCKIFPLDLVEKLGQEEITKLIAKSKDSVTNGAGNPTYGPALESYQEGE
jgi:hypothetical protein